MRKLLLIGLFLVSFIGRADIDADRFIVILKDNVDPYVFADNHGLEIEHVYSKALNGFTFLANGDEPQWLLSDIPEILVAVKDSEVSLIDPVEGDEGSLSIEAQTVPYGIKRVGSFACRNELPCRQRRAFVIDTGIDLDHPDLSVDTKLGYSVFKDNTGKRLSPNDDHNHGTHVAGIIGALDNNIGVKGVAAGANVVPVKVLNRFGFGSIAGVVEGIDYVAGVGRPGDVANMSLGGRANEVLDLAVKKAAAKGISFAIAAGNNGGDASLKSPARVDGPNIYTISAFDEYDNFASFSNYGAPVDKAEPGVRVLSTVKDGKYATFSGTSMAAPHAAGILMRGKGFNPVCQKVNNDPDGNPDCIGRLLTEGGDPPRCEPQPPVPAPEPKPDPKPDPEPEKPCKGKKCDKPKKPKKPKKDSA